MRTRPQRERTRWDWKPLIVIPMMVYLNAVPSNEMGYSPRTPGVSVMAPAGEGAAPINVGLQPLTAITDDTAASSQEGVGQGEVAVPAPVHGIDGKGRAYVLERNPPYPLREFTVMFTNERR